MSSFRIVLVFLSLALLGAILATQLSIHYTPAPLTSSFRISYALPGASPIILEQEVTSILENEFSQISGIKSLYSRSGYGTGYITIEFNAEEDLAFKKIEIITALRSIANQLPEETGFPTVEEESTDDQELSPLLIYALYAEKDLSDLQRIIQEHVTPKISALTGVGDIELSGVANRILDISYQPEVLKLHDLTIQQILSKINAATSLNMQYAISQDRLQLPVMVGDEFKFQELNQIPINADLKLGDIATVQLRDLELQSMNRINGQKAILLSIYANEGVNRLDVANVVESEIEAIAHDLEQDFSMTKRYDDTTYLREELNKATWRTAFSILILSLFIFAFTLRWKTLVVLFTGILANIGLVMLMCYLIGVEIHLYTIAGLTVSFGLLVDNAIIMLDHYVTHRNRKILSALMAASLTTIAALGIVFFLPAEDRQNLTDFAIIVMLALAISLLIAWVLTPALVRLFHLDHQAKKAGSARRKIRLFQIYYQAIFWLSGKKKWLMAAMILAFGLPVYLLPAQWDDQDWYNHTYGNDYFQDEIRPYIDKTLGGASRLFYRDVFESGGYREPGRTKLYVRASLPYGHTLEQMDLTLKKVEAYLKNIQGISLFLTYVNSGQSGSVVIEFDEKEEKGSLPYILKNKLIAKALDWGGVDWSVYGVGQGFSNAVGESLPAYRVQMKGFQYDKLEEMAGIFAKKLLLHKRIQEVNINEHQEWGSRDMEELVMKLGDRYYTQDLSSSQGALQDIQTLGYSTTANGYISLENMRYPVHFTPRRTASFSPFTLLHTAHEDVNLAAFAHLESQIGTPMIYKMDRQYLRIVGFEYFGSQRFGDEYLSKVMDEMATILPPGFTMKKNSYSWFGEKEKRQYSLILLLIVAIYLICLVFFENFYQPLLIVFIIPLSFIGLFLTFACGHFYFDQGGYAAFLMLGGLVVNAAIFIFSDYKQMQHGSQSKRVVKAVFHKAWPITLTVISTCVGLIPFLISGDTEVFWFSLAVGMIGGLLFSTLVVLIVLPALMIKRG